MTQITSIRPRQILSGVAALALVFSAAVQAQPQPQPPHPAQHAPAPKQPAPQMHKAQPHQPQPPMARPGQQHPPAAHAMRGTGPDRQWQRGNKVPAQYRTQHYVVNDWQRHGLQKPGRGQHWIQYGSDYLLVSIASGVIAQLVLGR